MSHEAEDIPYSLYIGADFKFFSNIKSIFHLNTNLYNVILVPIVHPMQYRTKAIDSSRISLPLSYSGTN